LVSDFGKDCGGRNMICPICGADPIDMRWTDFSGEANCMKCGIPLQIKWGTPAMMEDKDYPYTQVYHSLSVHFKEHWETTRKRARFGRWMGRHPEGVIEEQNAFWKWMDVNHPEWEPPQSSTLLQTSDVTEDTE
jgi:hypothetical protein